MAGTLTSEGGRRSNERATATAHLVVAMVAGDPMIGPSRHRLEGIQEVTLRRGAGEVRRRHRTLDLAPADAWLSTQHAVLKPVLHRWAIEDCGSRNGTIVNGARVRRMMLEDGDVVQLGHSFLVFRMAPPDAAAGDLDAAELEGKPAGLATLSPGLALQLDRLERVARSTHSVLIGGESGTGKELVARAVHALSGRRGSFVPVNCGSLPETLAESELFGHRRGAFSGAVAERTGYVRAADRGTLFLDEVADLRLPSQAALLRVLQERQVVPLGSERPLDVDVRFCAATHRALPDMVQAERFRGDLLARLSGFELRLPPLRERMEDLGLLVRALLRRRGQTATFQAATARALFAHPWPGNVRELEQTLGAALALGAGAPLGLAHLPPSLAARAEPGQPPGDRRPLRQAELEQRSELVRLLRAHQGNIAAVSRATGKGRQQVHRWLKRYRLDIDRFRQA
jgi:transcriptional regulator with GAF, ATPase, and Fis domain